MGSGREGNEVGKCPFTNFRKRKFALACIPYTERVTRSDSWCYSSRLLRVVRGIGIDVSYIGYMCVALCSLRGRSIGEWANQTAATAHRCRLSSCDFTCRTESSRCWETSR